MKMIPRHYPYYKSGKIDMLKELIAIYKPREPLEPFTTNAILLELEVRLRELEKDEPKSTVWKL